MLAPDPAGMLEAISADPMAMGYIPKSWLSSDVARITIERDLQLAFKHPILVLSEAEPAGKIQQYLICLQESGNP
jgi:hypothetical protein